uniref:Uncharacterized protein n=1 Tax=Anguilla anguilla TaxID=7936 RepID=A0A0E9XVQ0_ANGAN
MSVFWFLFFKSLSRLMILALRLSFRHFAKQGLK